MNIPRLEVIVISDVLANDSLIRTPGDILQNDIVNRELRQADREKMLCLHLNSKNQVISYEVVSIGSLNASLAHPREIFKGAILANAYCIILVHNHPSGDPQPSQTDVQTAKRIKEAGEILSIPLLDFLIVTPSKYCSFGERNLLEEVTK